MYFLDQVMLKDPLQQSEGKLHQLSKASDFTSLPSEKITNSYFTSEFFLFINLSVYAFYFPCKEAEF